MKLVNVTSSFALALVTLAGVAHAQPHDPLKGPPVKDSGVPGEDRKFGGGGDSRFDREQILPHRLFLRSFEVLRREDAGALRLSPEQDKRLEAAQEEFHAEVAKYRDEHREEARRLMQDLPPQERRRAQEFLLAGMRDRDGGPRRELGMREREGEGRPMAPREEGQKGERRERRGPREMDGPRGPRPGGESPGRPEGGRPMDAHEDMSPEARERAEAAKARLRELIEAAPKPDDAHSKMFAVLSAEQKAAVERELQRAREEMKARRDKMYEERVKGEIKGKMDEAEAQGATPEKLREFVRNLPETERRKIRDMDPEERRDYVRKLWEEENKP